MDSDICHEVGRLMVASCRVQNAGCKADGGGKIFATKATKGHEGFFIRFSFEERMGDGGRWTVDGGPRLGGLNLEN